MLRKCLSYNNPFQAMLVEGAVESSASQAPAATGGQQQQETEGHTIDLTTRDGQQIRLVAPLNIDPLAFATEYLKDLQQMQT